MKTNFTRRLSSISKAVLFVFGLVSLSLASNAQTLLTENFDATTIGGTSCTSVCAGPTGWTNTQAATNGTYWGAHSGTTTSSTTGPSGDHTSGTGRYMYTETSGGCNGNTAYLTTPSMNFSSYTGMVMEFWYHMYGSTMGTLYIDVSTDDGATWLTTPAYTKTGDQGNVWKNAVVNLAAYTGTGMGTVKIRFRALTGSSYYGDMAIDDVLIYAPSPMAYVSSTTTQDDSSAVSLGDNNQVIIGVEVETSGLLTPFSVSQMAFNTTGTTSASDIGAAKVYYTGTDANFGTTTQFGTTVATPSGSFNVTGTQALSMGTNYFWLVYDITTSATVSNYVDAQCTQITMTSTVGAKTPIITNPTGSRQIKLIKIIGNGTIINKSLPMECYYGYTYSQTVFTQAQLGGGKVIDTLYYYHTGPGWTTGDAIKVYMANTTRTSFASNTDWEPYANLTEVYSGTLTASSTAGWSKIVLTTPFVYGGTDNLIIAFDENTQGYHSSSDEYLNTASDSAVSIAYYADGTNPNPMSPPTANAGSPISTFPNIKLEYTLPMAMSYDTLLVEQNNNNPAVKGQESDILLTNIMIDGVTSPLNATALYYNTTGTTTLTDVDSAKVFYTGSGAQYTPANQFGSVVTTMGANIMFTGTQTLGFGSNNFWLVYYVNGTALDGHIIDAGLDSAVVNIVTYIPAISNPVGDRVIAGPYNGVYTLGNDSMDDFSSFNDAKLKLGLLGVSGHVTIMVDSGTYNEQITFNAVPGASATSTITFRSATGNADDVIIKNSASSTANNWTVRFDGAMYYAFENMTIKATGSSYGRVIEFTGATSNITLDSNIIMTSITSTSSNMCGIYSTSTNQHFNKITNNEIIGGYYAIFWYGVSATNLEKGNVFDGNEIKDFYYYGTYFHYQDSLQFTNNKLMNRRNASAGYGYGTRMNYCDGFTYTKNKLDIVGTGTVYGSYIYDCDSTMYSRSLYANNFVTTGGGTGTHYGIYCSYGNGLDMFHNSVNNVNGSTSSYVIRFYNSSATQGGNNLMNNIFANNGAGYAAYIYNNTYLSADYNNYYRSTPGNLLYWQGYRADLAALKLAYAGNNQNAVSMDPSYYTSTDLHTLSIPMNNMGTYVSRVTMDIDGNSRSMTTPDLGATEYTPPANDLSVIEWLTPLTGMNVNATATVSVKIANFGTASQVNPTVKYSIDGGVTTVTGTYSGTILSQDTVTHTFTATANFGSFGNYNCLAYTDLTTDQNRTNDTTFYDVYACTPLNGNYTIGLGTTNTFASFGEAVQALTSCGVTGPVVITADTGIFNEQLNITSIAGASATNTVTFKGTGGNTNIFFESTDGTKRAIITLDGAKHIILDGLNIVSGTAATYGWGVHLWHSADSNTIKNCHIDLNYTGTSSNYNGIVASNSNTSYSTTGINAKYLTIENNTFDKGYRAISFYGSSTTLLAEGVNILNNTFNDYTYAGIYLYYLDAVQVIGNELNGSGSYGMYLRYCDNASKFSKNNIMHTGSYGMYMYYCDGTATNRLEISNNFVSKSTSYGMYIQYPKHYDLVYNSINVSSGYGLRFYNSSATYTGHNVTNNNIVNTGSNYAAYIYNNTYLTSADYNNFYSPTGSYVYWGGVRADLAAVKAAYPGTNQNSVSMDPEFLSITDLHTYSIPFNNLGTPITLVTTDIDGETRSLTTPNIGADEYTPPANDLGVVEIISAFDSYCGSADSLYVVVKNFGTATQTSVPVTFAGTSPTGPISLSGTITSIASLQLDTVYVGMLVANAAGMYDAVAYATLATDTMQTNDSMIISGMVYTPDSIGYVQTFDSLNPAKWDMNGNGSFNWMFHSSGAMYANFWSYNAGNTCEMISPAINIPIGNPAYLGYSYSYNNGYLSSYNDTLEIYVKSCGDANWTLLDTRDASDMGTTGGGSTTPGNYMDYGIMIPASMQGTNVRIMFRGVSDYGPNLYIDAMTVFNAPIVAIGPDTALCVGDSITLDAGAFFGAKYLWTKGIDTVSINQSFNTMIAGSYVAKVSQFGVVGLDAINIVFNSTPNATFTGLNATYCGNELASTLIPNTTGGVFSGSGVIGSSFDPSIPTPGTFDIEYTLTNAVGCTSTSIQSVTTFAIPMVNFTGLAANYCDDESIDTLIGTPTNGVFSGNGVNGVLFDPNITGAGSQAISYIFTDSLGCSDTATITTMVNASPMVTFTGLSANYCDNGILDTLIGSPVNGSFSGNGINGASFNPITAGLGIQVITYQFTDSMGCSGTVTDSTIVNASPIVTFTGLAISYCDNEPFDTLYGIPNNGVFSGNGISGSIFDPVISGAGTQMVEYLYTDSLGCSNTATNSTMILASPIVNIGNDTTIKHSHPITLDAGAGFTSYLWNTGTSNQSITLAGYSIPIGTTKAVSVIVTDVDGCLGTDTINIDVDNDLSMDDYYDNIKMKMYPNPTKGQFNMTIKGMQGEVKMSILDITGQIVFTEILNVTTNYVGKFDLRTLSSGVYYINLTSDNNRSVKKLIINK